MSDIASSADDIRGDNDGDGQRDGDRNVDHTARIPIDSAIPTPAKPCSETVARCADKAIDYYAFKIAKLNAVGVPDRQSALKYVVHLVGDLHQPLHGADPIGYDYVDLPGHNLRIPLDQMLPADLEANPNRYYNIHSIWDLILTLDYSATMNLTSYSQLAADVMARQGTVIVTGTPRAWAIESSNIARDQIYTDPGNPTPPACTNAACLTPQPLMLDAGYSARKYPIVQQRLKQAGLRLPCVLFKALTTEDPCNPADV